MPVTDDPNHPHLREPGPDGQHQFYLVLSTEERDKGFVRPVRNAYVHDVCGVVTYMGPSIAETYARDPYFYGRTYCAGCKDHFPVGEHGEFHWDGPYDPITGEYHTDKVGT